MTHNLRVGAVLLAFFALLVSLPAADLPPDATWRVWLEPKFMRSAASAPIAGSQRTELAGGALEDDTLIPFSKKQWEGSRMEWGDFLASARANSAADLAQIQPRYVRNRQKVIDYAVLQSEKPIVASAVLAPKFLNLFHDTLGPKVLLVVPNRYTAYVFPRLASDYQEYSPMVLTDYRATPFPVSVEVFEVSAQGFRAIGAYEAP